MMRRIFLSILVLFSCNAAELIVNGSFETGDFTGWTVVDQAGSAGTWSVYNSGYFLPPPYGTYAAITHQSHPCSTVLYQDVTIPPGIIATLKFTYYYENTAGFFHTPTPETLDYFGDVPPNPNNQQYRVDIMNPSSTPFSVASGDVLMNLLQSKSGDPLTLGYTSETFDLTPFAGQTIRLRFAEADNLSFFNFAVDGISITTEPPPPPPPSPPFLTKFTGRTVENQFLTQTEYAQVLSWEKSSDPVIVEYEIVLGNKVIASVPASCPSQVCLHNQEKCCRPCYRLIGVDADGNEIASLPITWL